MATIETPDYLCPTCGTTLELFANGDNGPQDDRWTCDQCGIEFPHSEFPLPKGYVKNALKWEREQRLKDAQEDDRLRLAAWNLWAQSPEQ